MKRYQIYLEPEAVRVLDEVQKSCGAAARASFKKQWGNSCAIWEEL